MGHGALIRASKFGLILLLSQISIAEATEIKVIASRGVGGVVTELGRQFELKTGHRVQTDFEVIPVLRRKIEAGTAFDITILNRDAIDDLIQQGKIIRDTRTDFGRSGLGVATRKGGGTPDISSAEAFKHAMLEAKSVGHSKEGLSGVYFLAVLDQLGIAADMKPKLRAYEGADIRQAIATGEVELGVIDIGPILAIPSAEFIGPLPKELQKYVVFTAGVATSTNDLATSRSLLQFMTAPDAGPIFKAKGLERD